MTSLLDYSPIHAPVCTTLSPIWLIPSSGPTGFPLQSNCPILPFLSGLQSRPVGPAPPAPILYPWEDHRQHSVPIPLQRAGEGKGRGASLISRHSPETTAGPRKADSRDRELQIRARRGARTEERCGDGRGRVLRVV